MGANWVAEHYLWTRQCFSKKGLMILVWPHLRSLLAFASCFPGKPLQATFNEAWATFGYSELLFGLLGFPGRCLLLLEVFLSCLLDPAKKLNF